MTERITPDIGVPKPVNNPLAKIKVTKKELQKYLKKRKIPNTKRARQAAIKAIRRAKYIASLPKAKDISITQSDAPWQAIYGQCRLGGYYSFIHQSHSSGSSTNDLLHCVISFACHEIESVEKVFVDNNQVLFPAHAADYRVWANGGIKPDGSSINYTNLVWFALNVGTVGQAALPDLVSDLPAYWTSNHKQSNRAHCYIKFKYNAEIFPNDFPEVFLEVKGKKVYDPRTGTTYYTNNAALCIADYLTDTVYGMGYSWTEIDTTSLSDAADVCDENVSLAGGGTEKRYTVNGYFDTDDDHNQILSNLESAMAGFVSLENGKWKFWPGEYRTPTVTLTEDDLRSEPVITVLESEGEIFNSVRGTFVSSENGYEVTDYPARSINAYVSTDNGKKIWGEVNLPFTTSSTMAQRISRIELERSRRQTKIRATWGLKAFQLEPGDTVMITLARYGFSSTVFQVDDWDLLIGEDQAVEVDLLLSATDSGVYSWVPGTDEQQINISPSTNLPDPNNVSAPTGLALASGTAYLDIRLDGTIFSRIFASWTQATDAYVVQGGKVEAQYKKSADSSWIGLSPLSGDASFTYILDVQDGTAYDVRIRFVNGLGVHSAWTSVTNHTVIGKTAPPSDVTGFSSSVNDDGIRLTWTQISDLDRSEYEIRSGASWAAGTIIARIRASDGTAFIYPYRTAGTVTLRIKAIDTSGNYSTNDAVVAVTLLGPNPITNFQTSIVDNNVLLDWDKPVETTFSVHQYDVYKGDTLATAILLGTVFGTFHTYVERIGGTFTYWVIAIDIGGNRSTAVSAQATITAPEDFYIRDDQDPTPEFSNWRNFVIGGSDIALAEPTDTVYLPVNTHVTGGIPPYLIEPETFENWFDNNGWNTLQDAINAGYDEWLQPASDLGFMEMLIDYGVVFSSSFIRWTWDEIVMGDPSIIVPTVSYSQDGITWVDYPSATQIFAESFRYVKLRLDAEATSSFSLSRIYNQRLVISLQRVEETGSVSANASDISGTTVNFTKSFLDVEDIQLTVEGTDPAYPVLNFIDIPNPVFFKVLVFDQDGSRITKSVRYRVRGAVSP